MSIDFFLLYLRIPLSLLSSFAALLQLSLAIPSLFTWASLYTAGQFKKQDIAQIHSFSAHSIVIISNPSLKNLKNLFKMGKLSSAIKAGQTAAQYANTANTARNNANEFRQADKKQMGRDAGRYAFNEGASTGKTMGKTWLKTFEVIPRIVCRTLQFILALVACGFYGNRVQADHNGDHGYSPEWIFAIIVAGLSAATSVVFMAAASAGAIPLIGSRLKLLKTHRAFAWDASLFIAWLVVFGIFAGIFLKRKSDEPYKGASTGTMKTAVWVDLVNSILWMGSAGYGCFKTFLGRKVDSASDRVGNKLFSKKGNNEHEMKNYPESV